MGAVTVADGTTRRSIVDEFLRQLDVTRHGHLAGEEFLPTRLMIALNRVLPVSGAAVSVLAGMRVPLGASSEVAARAELLQSTLGEGPCLAAYHQDEPLAADEDVMAARWPLFHHELIEQTPFRAVASIPLQAGPARFGAIDLYWNTAHIPDELGALETATAFAAIIAGQLTAQPVRPGGPAGVPIPPWVEAPAAQRRLHVWIAIGMLTAARQLSSADALAVLQAAAYSRHTTLDELADQLIERSIPLEDIAS